MRSLTVWKSSIVSVDVDGAGHRDQSAARRWSSRRATIDDDHRVLERCAGHDVARLEVELEQLADRCAGATAFVDLLPGSSAGIDEL